MLKICSVINNIPTLEEFLKNGRVGDSEGVLEKTYESIEEIGKFCKSCNWVIENPHEAIQIFLINACGVFRLIALVICGGAIIGAIFGHGGAMKYVPITLSAYIVFRILAVIL